MRVASATDPVSTTRSSRFCSSAASTSHIPSITIPTGNDPWQLTHTTINTGKTITAAKSA